MLQWLPSRQLANMLQGSRQANLLNRWGFTCSCVRCIAEGTLVHDDAAWFCSGCAAFAKEDAVDDFSDSSSVSDGGDTDSIRASSGEEPPSFPLTA